MEIKSKINTIYVSKLESPIPILVTRILNDAIKVAIHIQFIDTTPGEHKLYIGVYNQNKKMLVNPKESMVIDLQHNGKNIQTLINNSKERLLMGDIAFKIEATMEAPDNDIITITVKLDDGDVNKIKFVAIGKEN